MNILFLTLVDFNTIDDRGIYTDLLRQFAKHGHDLYIISPVEKRKNQETRLIKSENTTILKLKIGNTQKTNIIEKGISTVRIEPQFIAGIKKYFSDVKFDLVMYSTPPITFCNAIEFVKKRDGAKTYLLLKDIFPQNAVDIGMMTKSGIKSVLYKYFRKKEKKLYAISDYIGCMSQANVDYVIEHNKEVNPDIVEECPNSIEPIEVQVDEAIRTTIREKYNLPQDKLIFIYGGNLGKPQDIPFVIECIKKSRAIDFVHFVICGNGTEYGLIDAYMKSTQPKNLTLIQGLPVEEYNQLVAACDVGMLFLDHRFTIPNFPSRLLSYMTYSLPVMVCTDTNSDIGKIAEDNDFGVFCESDDTEGFVKALESFRNTENRIRMGENAHRYMIDNYDVERCYSIIMNHFTEA